MEKSESEDSTYTELSGYLLADRAKYLPPIPNHLRTYLWENAWDSNRSREEILVRKGPRALLRRDIMRLAYCHENPTDMELIPEIVYFYKEVINRKNRDSKIYFCDPFDLSEDKPRPRFLKWIAHYFFDMTKFLIPVYYRNHWSLIVVDMYETKILYVDSLQNYDRKCAKRITKMVYHLMKDEYRKYYYNVFFDFTHWKMGYTKERPIQEYEHDSGVFVCAYAEFLIKGVPKIYTADDVHYLREKIAIELLQVKLLE